MTDQEFYEKCLAEEKRFEFPTFDRGDVWNLGCSLVEAASKASGPLAVSIWLNGTEIFRYYAKGTGKHNEDWIERKHKTVATHEMASMTYKAMLTAKGMTLEEDGHTSFEYAACGGGFPIKLKGGAVIGFIGMSGLSDAEDHEAIIIGLEDYFCKTFK